MSSYRVVLDEKDPLLGVAVDCISPRPSDVADPSSLDSVSPGTSGLEKLSL